MAGNEERPAGRHPRRGESFFGGEYVEGESSATGAARNHSRNEIISESRKAVEESMKLLFTKKLDANDLSRLVLDPTSLGAVMIALTVAETEKVVSGNNFLKVETEDPSRTPYELHLGRCPVTNTYGFGNKWREIVAANSLEKGDMLQMWAHRVGAENELRLKIDLEEVAGYGTVEDMKVDSKSLALALESAFKEGETADPARKKSIIEIRTEPIMLFKRVLDTYDIRESVNQLQLEYINIIGGLRRALTKLEMRKVEREDDFLSVITEDLLDSQYEMHLERSSIFCGYALGNDWNLFVFANELKEGDLVEGWWFRAGTEFRLKLIVAKK